MAEKPVVYVAMSADIVHSGHLNILSEASKLGRVVVGLLTDEAIATYKHLPFMAYQQRFLVVEQLKDVSEVISQSTLDYRPNLRALRPQFVVHGSDWRRGIQEEIRKQVIETIAEWGGTLVEPEYTDGISSTEIRQRVALAGTSPDQRSLQLARLLGAGRTVRVMEAHNGLSARVVEYSEYQSPDGAARTFDAIWLSSLTDSIAKGKPDTEIVDRSSRISTVNEILEVSSKPIIMDADTGGNENQLIDLVRTLERLGVSATVVEDKQGAKSNSLLDESTVQRQEDVDVFASKIRAAVNARRSEHFYVIARIESLVLGKSVDDAIARAEAYLEAGASAIMIHSKSSDGKDVQEFCERYKLLDDKQPLMVVPTTYNEVYEDELRDWGANIIVYANHLLRACYPAMDAVAQQILANQRAFEAEKNLLPLQEFIRLADSQ